MQEEFSLKFDKILRFIASGYDWNTEKGAVAHATAPLLMFSILSTNTMQISYNSVFCENQLSSAATAAVAVALRADCVRGLALAKLSVLHVRAGTLLQAELRKFFPVAIRRFPFAASLDEGEKLFFGHFHLAETLCALLLHAAA